MKTEWDYTQLADNYLLRPDYADAAIDAMLRIAGVGNGDHVCDVGAGTAHLTAMLAGRGLEVNAVEPNDAMRNNGIQRTSAMVNVLWFEGTGEKTGQMDQTFDLVTFGSSFNVCDRSLALVETARILKPRGWFACLWNHRRLDDPVQAEIESIIKRHVKDYGYGTRREDQTAVIDASGLFGSVVHLDAAVVHRQTVSDCVRAWRSHATLARQAGNDFKKVVAEIERFLLGLGADTLSVPYETHIWMARLS